MGWPKGKPRKPRVADVVTSLEQVEVKPEEVVIPTSEGVIVSEKSSIEEMAISVSPGVMPALTDPHFDPFTKFKTDTKNFAYRAINSRANLRREREAQGWQPIPGAEYGDLVLAKIPRDVDSKMKLAQSERTKRQTDATKATFKEQAASSGVRTFEEK
jgi:hypothetical protein